MDSGLDNLTVGQTRTILLNYLVNDGQGAAVSQTQQLVISGVNDAPVVAAALTSTTTKGAAAYNLNLLAGATDIDGSDLYVQNLRYAINGNASDGSTPSYLQWNGTELRVNPSDAALSGLYNGDKATIVAMYDVQDNFGAKVAQTETITINGTGQAPVVVMPPVTPAPPSTPPSTQPTTPVTPVTPVTPPTPSVVNNITPYGGVSINGLQQVGMTLSANTSQLVDPNGMAANSLSYQWFRDGVAIGNASNASYQVVNADSGHNLSVTVSFRDLAGFNEAVSSYALYAFGGTPVATGPAVNQNPYGGVSINGNAKVGDTLSANLSQLVDPNGIAAGTTTYQWLKDGNLIAGATTDRYNVLATDATSNLSVKVGFADLVGNNETVSSYSLYAYF
jgi:hypothetical protein